MAKKDKVAAAAKEAKPEVVVTSSKRPEPIGCETCGDKAIPDPEGKFACGRCKTVRID
jgi:hypothetical protein